MDPSADVPEVLSRWEATGGSWRVVGRSAERVTVALCSCEDQEMDRVEVTDPDFARRSQLGDEPAG
ncbi:hypothetical protein [Nocardioides antri]|uniref:Uncharacterized protein n=1 Tax=Nocardioides antri TaxID=2607659 RepID=A0A5B1LW00_9ACTN|nr:hypothetical protein [Nocardioides antri]KAA1424328.1 hypothetical protein F0U47_19030 [Nocardioides antri]